MMLVPLLFLLAQEQRPTPLLPARPRDPFVFRCVLDQRPRMVVVALDDELWAAWDTAQGGLYRAWKGGVHFDGPVYTTVHGPQPTTLGTPYTLGVDGSPWNAYVGGRKVAARASWMGYRLEGPSVTLEWKVEFGADRAVLVRERPEFVRPKEWLSAEQLESAVLGDGSQPGLRRDFEALGLRDGEQVSLTMRTDGVAAKLALALERERFEDVKDAHGVVVDTRVFSELPLTERMPRNAVVLVFAPRAAVEDGK